MPKRPPKRPLSPAEDETLEAPKAQEGGDKKRRPNTTLFVSNLPYTATSTDLSTFFSDIGPIRRAFVVTDRETRKSKGVGYVAFALADDAERAKKELANVKFAGSRKLRIDWADKKGEHVPSSTKKSAEKGTSGTEARRPGKRAKVEVKPPPAPAEDDSSAEDDGDEDDYEEDEDEEGGLSESDDEEDTDDGEDADTNNGEAESEEEEPKARPQLPGTEEGTTLFVRNLPYEATEEELKNLFRKFGPLRYARITMDAASGRPRGTGFVCFWKHEDSQTTLKRAAVVEEEAGGRNTVETRTKNPFTLPSVLTADPSSALASDFTLHGRVLNVVPAVNRDQAVKLRVEGEQRRQKQDKRNTYLLHEGVVFPHSPAAGQLTEAEVDKRVTSFNARRKLLASNPSLYISKTRLSIRQLPLFATDRTLKRLASHAVRQFEAEVKEGKRQPLTEAELKDDAVANVAGNKNKKRGIKPSLVCQAKLVRQADRLDPLTGLGRSKGYGFLELRTHRDALRVLRWANHNAKVAGLMKEWWMEELREVIGKLEETQKQAGKDKAKDKAKGKGKDKSDGSQQKSKGAAEVADEGDAETRLQRLRKKLNELEQGKVGQASASSAEVGASTRGSLLLIEFSIENVQVVKRRTERAERSRASAKARKDAS